MTDTDPSSHEMTIRLPYLRLIASGVKTVEVRVGYPRMRKIKAGDQLTFISGDERVTTQVRRVTEYPDFGVMLDREDARSIGGELGESRDDLLAVIRSIYPPDKERLGVLAIEIERT
jgi:ASC-1-like (ASCH) protein